MNDFISKFVVSTAARIVQDLATTGAGYLAAHGFIGADQVQGTIGSVCFLAMLGINYLTHNVHSDTAYKAGAANATAIRRMKP